MQRSSVGAKQTKATVGLKVPRAQGITEQHLYSAFIYGSERQQRRIEQWGRMNRRILKNIGKPATQDGTSVK